MRRWLSSAAAACVILLLPLAARATTFTVTLNSTTFSPSTITINVGDTIHWVVATGIHTVTSGTGSSDPSSGALFDKTLSGSQTYDFTFNSAGSFPYYCVFHESLGMKATITVAATPVTPSTWGKVKALFR